MHDHQSDWKSIYSDLDDMSGLNDPFMGDDSTHSLVNSQQINHAKSVFRQLKQRAFKTLDGIKDLKPQDKQMVQMKINDLITRTQISLQNVDHKDQISGLIHKTRIQLHRIVLIKKFDNFIDQIISEIKQASLSKSQRNAAISEMKTNDRYTKQDLIKSQTMTSLNTSVLSGKNSVNGALVKYVADSRIYIGNQLKSVTDKVHHQIEIQPNLNIAAKYLAYQQIGTVKAGIDADLMSTDEFTGLEQVKRQGLERLKSIVDDKNKVLANLTEFNQFVIKIRTMIAEISQLSSDDKLYLEQRIDDYQKAVENQVQQHDSNHGNDFSFREHHLSLMVIDMIFKAYRRKIASHRTSLSSEQQNSTINDLEAIINDVNDKLEQSHLKSSIEDSLIDGLKRLKTVAEKIDTVIYRNQIQQDVQDISSKIKHLYELSSTDKNHLRARINILGRHLLQNRSDMTTAAAEKRLYDSFHKQARYMTQASLHHIFNNLYKQIQASHLSSEDTHKCLMRLVEIRRKKVDYESKQILIKNVLNRSLILDKNENLRRMTKLNNDLHRQIDSFDIASQLDDALQQDLIAFSQRINDADKLSVADREEQEFESIAYRKLCRLYNGVDSPQAQALQDLIVQAKKVHYQINVAILDPQIKWWINEQVSKHTNAYLYKLLSIHDESSLKRYVTTAIKGTQHELLKAVQYVKDSYVKQTDQLFKKLNNQLNAYSVSWNVLDKTGFIQSHMVKRMKGAEDLLQVEYAKQIGNQKVNGLVNGVITKVDSKKRHASQLINTLNKSIQARLTQIKLKDRHVNFGFLNRVLNIMNQAEYYINQCLDSDVETNVHYYGHVLGRILRQSYLHEWLLIVNKAHASIDALSNVRASSKMKVLQSVQDTKLKVIAKLQKCDRSELKQVLQDNNEKIQKLVTHSIYLDPVKKQARQGLMSLHNAIQAQIKGAFDSKSSEKYLVQLEKISQNINDQLQLNDDRKVKMIYADKRKELGTFGLKIGRKIQMNRFIKFTHKFGKQLDGLKMLANKEVQLANDRFNRYYHKVVYQISNAPDLETCQQNETQGEKAVNKILYKDQVINDSKTKFYHTLASKIKLAKHQISSLKSLQIKDKKDSNHLLDQIRRQAYQNVKQSMSRNQMLAAADKSHKMVKQVIDKVSSASVLVAAIKSANNQVFQSALDKHQKDATLKQINQIIDSGINNQFGEHHKTSKKPHRSNWKRPNDHRGQHHDHHGVDHHFDDFDVDDMTNDSSHKKSSVLSSILKVFKNFFRWLRVKLANAF